MADVPDPEAAERARRRTYKTKYKRDVLAEYEAATGPGSCTPSGSLTCPRRRYTQILLDESRYLCSESTMCRLLRTVHGHVQDRRRQAVHPPRVKPELIATGLTQVLVLGHHQAGRAGEVDLLLPVLDHRHLRPLPSAGCSPPASPRSSPNGCSPTPSPSSGSTLADLGVSKSHSRPHCSNDNPFSQAQFKTLKYQSDFPDQFGCLEDARTFCAVCYRWYNHDHRHSGMGMHTPHDVHHGHPTSAREARAHTLNLAYTTTPDMTQPG